MDTGAERLVGQQSKVANKVRFLEESTGVGRTIQCNAFSTVTLMMFKILHSMLFLSGKELPTPFSHLPQSNPSKCLVGRH